MALKRRQPESSGEEVPGWIVSFSDMITLLLAFFVLLQAFAHERDPELFFIGQGSFRRAISGMGIPDWLYGRQPRARHDFRRVRFTMEESPDEDYQKQRNPDAEAQRIHDLFARLEGMMTVRCRDVSQRPVNVVATPITFSPGSAKLDQAAQKYLRDFALNLPARGGAPLGGASEICIIALANDVRRADEQYMLSAQRAQAVEEFLRRAVAGAGTAPASAWDVRSRGAAAGGDWSRVLGIIPRRTYVAIVVMGATKG